METSNESVNLSSWHDEDKLTSTLKKSLLTWDDFSPDWERKFIDGVESMRTIPHISLMRFSFIKVKFQDQRKPERVIPKNSSMTSLSRQHSSDLELFPFNTKGHKQDINHHHHHHQHHPHPPLGELKPTASVGSKKKASDMMFKMMDKDERPKVKNRYLLKVFRKTRSKMRGLFRMNRENISDERHQEEPNKEQKSELSTTTNTTTTIGGRPLSYAQSFHPNDSVHLALQLLRLNNPLHDYSELQRKKRIKRLNQIMDKDEGPYFTDYRIKLLKLGRPILGMEFWGNFCGIERSQLKKITSSALWPQSRTELARKFIEDKFEQIRVKELSWLQKKIQVFVEAHKFLKGRQQPLRPPRRVITPDEKFRVVQHVRLVNPNVDLKRISMNKAWKKRILETLKRLYVLYINWGNEKPPRKVSIEEALEDLLIWILDEEQAKTRFIALLKDQIKKEIL